MIVDFRCGETELIWCGVFSRKLPHDIQKTALRKLRMLNNAKVLRDLSVPPNNHLEALKDNRLGQHSTAQHSIRINGQWSMVNGQWRICFVWTEGGPAHVEIVDYH
ncbi:MAG: type II toxin-antitoxin system RelE/ParE family toxin [Azospirillaceae bacterium]|nr:type II toxin-antitoxin system RelE/ParE family toxin [Azospirillaceae bacterium]